MHIIWQESQYDLRRNVSSHLPLKASVTGATRFVSFGITIKSSNPTTGIGVRQRIHVFLSCAGTKPARIEFRSQDPSKCQKIHRIFGVRKGYAILRRTRRRKSKCAIISVCNHHAVKAQSEA